jgi:DNA topoisomerase-3
MIENLIHRQYIKRDQKRLISTQNGRDVIRNLQNEELKSVHLTADWENLLKQIEDGQIDPQIFYDKLKAFIPKMLSDLANTPAMQLTKVQETPRSVNRPNNNSEDQSPTKSTRSRTTKSTTEKSTTAKSTTAKSTTAKKSAISLPEKIDQTLCPKCKQGYLIKGRTAFGCGRWREGCHFLIPFQYDGIVILERQAIEIAILYRVKNFLEKEGQYYDLHLCLEIEPPLKLQVNPDSKYAHAKTKGFSEKSKAYQYQNVESSPTSWRNLAKRS